MITMPGTTWTRLTRRLGGDGNQLRRRSDLIEAWLRPVTIASFLVLCPAVSVVSAIWIHSDNAAVQRAQLSWHRVDAVLLHPVPGPAMTDKDASTWTVWTPATWTSGGRKHVGDIPAAARSQAGSVVPVWLNRAGLVQSPPLTAGQVRDRVITSTMIALAILAVLLAGLGWLVRRALDRRRLNYWETAWLAVGPRWSHQDEH